MTHGPFLRSRVKRAEREDQTALPPPARPSVRPSARPPVRSPSVRSFARSACPPVRPPARPSASPFPRLKRRLVIFGHIARPVFVVLFRLTFCDPISGQFMFSYFVSVLVSPCFGSRLNRGITVRTTFKFS